MDADAATTHATAPSAAPAPTPADAFAPRAAEAPQDALAPLEGLDELPVAEHVARFEALHEALRIRLETPPTAGGGT